eukprot:TRINITY_DN9032_c0_g1_i1.p1 TRINITY_DN9032_c0_g1~~TRINITY_DN9032_c0_g1_i1.p1  ORF type:complete len:476 (-),score=165.55 TRINITY_DN9032_c0_g1_i1:55-1482(-)
MLKVLRNFSGVSARKVNARIPTRKIATNANWGSYPKNVGIVGMDTYFPKTFVKQSDLEAFDKVSAGKYNVGLEQEAMAFSGDREDIYSMCLTVTQNLVEKYGISYKDIGRLEVGTETVLDKSKSIKSVLMQLFEKSGNFDVEGVDNINACYGGTAALLNATQWIESSSWDGRYALVVCGDIAVYAPGAARPTGGAGVVAMLVGKDAPIVLERGVRATHVENVYDFYKPNLESEYPTVDGHLSITCYYRALDNCYRIYRDRFHKVFGKDFSLDQADYALFHSPFWKLVKKSYARMMYLDYLKNPSASAFANVPSKLKELTAEQSYNDKEVAKVFGDLSLPSFNKKTEVGSLLPKNLGNSYTASLYTGLISLVSKEKDNLVGKRVLLFSYGSGMVATLFSLNINGSVAGISDKADVVRRLSQRTHHNAESFTAALKDRETFHSASNFTPKGSVDELEKGAYYLEKIDDLKRRTYARK